MQECTLMPGSGLITMTNGAIRLYSISHIHASHFVCPLSPQKDALQTLSSEHMVVKNMMNIFRDSVPEEVNYWPHECTNAGKNYHKV